MHTFDLNINEVSKIEGKASVTVKVKDDKVEECTFAITEFKRFYTLALRGKDVTALPQLSCRICGTCSNAHLLCAIKAAEHALGVTPTPQTQTLRELVNYGLLIRDHALHCYVFALPDILGIDNFLELDENKPEEHQILDDCFAIKAAGNNLGKAIGGRSVHAPYPTVGAFSKLPDKAEFPKLIEELESVRPAVLRLIDRFLKCDFHLPLDCEYAAVLDDRFTLLGGEIVDSRGGRYPADEFGAKLTKVTLPYSQASGYKYLDGMFLVGSIARLNVGKDKLHERTRKDAAEAVEKFPSNNIYHNNLAQAIEILHSIDSSIDILKTLDIKPEPYTPVLKKAGTGIGVIEAPRGTLWYKLTLDEKGIITDIQIIVPTGLNQLEIGGSLKKHLENNLDKDHEALSLDMERIVRAYDPCMSCASHFLKIKWKK